MIEDISKEFQKVFDAIDEFTDYLNDTLKQRTQAYLRDSLCQVVNLEKKLEKKKTNDNLRSECITFLRDFGIKESYKGTEYLIYTLLTYNSSDNVSLKELYKELAQKYNINIHSIRITFVNALKSVDDEYMTTKDSLYAIMRDWEIYKQDKGLE